MIRAELSEKEQNFLLYGSYTVDGERVDKKVEGVYKQFKRLVLMKGPEEQNDYTLKKIAQFLYECECPDCKGKRLNDTTLSCRIGGYNIAEMCEMEFSTLREELERIDDPRAASVVAQLTASLDRMAESKAIRLYLRVYRGADGEWNYHYGKVLKKELDLVYCRDALFTKLHF